MAENRRFGPGPFFLVLDEATNNDLDPHTESLTGVLVRVSQASSVRRAFYSVMQRFICPKPQTINLDPPEVHFSDLLRDQPDAVKLEVVSGIVELVVTQQLPIFRVSYYLTKEFRQYLREPTKKFPSFMWFGIQTVIEPVLAEDVVIPLFDAGFDPGFQPVVDALAASVKICDIMRAVGKGANISILHSENLAEVMFSDSKNSALVQIADVVAGLRRLAETARINLSYEATDFRSALLNSGRLLDPLVVYDDTILMQFHS